MPVSGGKTEATGDAQRLTSSALGQFRDADYEVKLYVNQQFLNKCPGVSVAEDSSMISTYDPSVGEHTNIRNLQHLNAASISRVCETDLLTVEMIIKEIVAQLRHQLNKGVNVRLQFKIGKLTSQNGRLCWRGMQDDEKKRDISENVADRSQMYSTATS